MWRRAPIYPACNCRDGVLWLLLLLLVLCFSLYGQAQVTDPEEVKALRAVKSSLIDPWKNLTNWNNKDPCITRWKGVHCYNRTLDDGYLHVRELELMKMNLSGTLAPELGLLSRLKILNFMWNNIGGSIPKEIGNLTNLELLLLNGNQLTGSLPGELGYMPHLDRIQIDQNKISGPIPKSFANLNKTQHFHMNNNSISGEIPRELSRLPSLIHFLLDNNNLSGSLPAEFSELPNLLILQLDNNNFSGNEIPASYGKMNKLLKLSLRNCSLNGSIPDLSGIANLSYIDLSLNQLSGPIPPEKLSGNLTTIILSHNSLNGTIPQYFSSLHRLQKVSLDHNFLNGSVPSTLWESSRLSTAPNLTLDFRNNALTGISGRSSVPANVTLLLEGNPLCSNNSIAALYCGSETRVDNTQDMTNDTNGCPALACPLPYEYAPMTAELPCYCAAPLIIDYRLKSPIFSDFRPYQFSFEEYITSGLDLNLEQLNISSTSWQEGPRLKMVLKIFPGYEPNRLFNLSEVHRIWDKFAEWEIPENETFGPYELLDFILLDPYIAEFPHSSSPSGISKGALAGIIVGTFAGAFTLSAVIVLLIIKKYSRKYNGISRRRKSSRIPIKAEGMRGFTYEEMAHATSNFSSSLEVGKGGYGKVYKGVLNDGALVAVKRAEEGSLQGNKEFCTEIELLSRLHHRHLVSLIGYCDKRGEQMLVYEFMPNGTLRDHLSATSAQSLCFATRLRIALGSARGILYLHTEADPPIFHRDIKATNILLDSHFTAKVADFGLSRLAPLPDSDGVVPNHVSTVVRGTPGYLDPEYCLTHKLTDKSDVYSLGVVLLELLTGMKPISHGRNLVREVNTSYQSGNIFSVVDERMGSYPQECVERFASLALKCSQDEADGRPTMTEVVRELESIMQMMPPESDTRSTTEFSSNNQMTRDRDSNSPSPRTRKNVFVSVDVSGSNLVSGTFPSISAR